MEKVIVITLFLFLSSVYAQSPVSEGTYTVGGNISFTSTSDSHSSENHNNLIISPNLGYFFIDNIYTGTSILYSYQSSGDFSATTYGFGPTIRYYFDVERVKPFLGLEYVYSFRSSGDDPDENTQTTFTISGGVDYFVTNYFAIEGSVNYSFINYNFDDGHTSSDNDMNQLNIGIGAKYFIH